MRVLVTGAQGQVGTELIARGKALGFEMLAAGSAELDITQQAAVAAYVQEQSPDIVINAAAYTAVDTAETEQERAFAVNRDGPSHLAKACAARGIPLLHLSTDYVFDGALNDGALNGGADALDTAANSAYREDDVCRPTGVYGASKREGECAVIEQLGQHIILRVAWVFGEHGQNFVRTMLRLGKERSELGVVADQRGAPTWARDIADVLLGLVAKYSECGDLAWGVYHYVGKSAVSWHGFAEAIFAQAQALDMINKVPQVKALTSEQYPTPAQRPKNAVLDCTKIKEVFGIHQADWRIGLKDVLSQWKQQ